MIKALSLNKPEYPYLFLGVLMAMAVGIIEPLFALVYSEMFNVSAFYFIAYIKRNDSRIILFHSLASINVSATPKNAK